MAVTGDFEEKNIVGYLKTKMGLIFWCFKGEKKVIGGVLREINTNFERE